MRSLCRLALLLMSVVSLAVLRPGVVESLCLEQGKVAPDFAISDLDGKPVTLSSYRGKVVFLAFWASWCPRCMEELAFLQGLYTGLSKDMVVLAINEETQNLSSAQIDNLRRELTGLGIGYPVLLDRNLDVWKPYCITALPTSVILDREGKVRFAEANYYWASQNKFRAVLSELGISVP